MKDIKELDAVVTKALVAVAKGMVSGTQKASKELAKEVRSRATLPPEATQFPVEWDKHQNANVFPDYVNSIRSIPVKDEENTVRGGVRSNYLVFWDKYNIIVPYGMFIEWGTGPIGARTVSTPFATNKFSYTYVEWDKFTVGQMALYSEFGMSAHPHWHPALVDFAPRLPEILSSEIKRNIRNG